MQDGQRVTITGGMKEFIGKEGTVRGYEMDAKTKLYRVYLDEPVDIPGVGLVGDDLWSSEFLRKHIPVVARVRR